MKFFDKRRAYTRCKREQIQIENGDLIGVRWIDVNKGGAQNPNCQSRLVGREFNTYKDDSLYAATPPLEAFRAIVSHAATRTRRGRMRELMVNGISRAYVHAPAKRSLFIELPAEDTDAMPGEVVLAWN